MSHQKPFANVYHYHHHWLTLEKIYIMVVYKFVNSQSFYLKQVNCIQCVLHLNKPNFKNQTEKYVL